MKITEDIMYVGVNDHEVDLFEGQYVVPNGMAYNSYVILDEKTAVMDTVDQRGSSQWLANVEEALAADFEAEQRLRHPYTRALFRAMPRHGFKAASGTQPYAADMPAGCPYGPRCPDMDEGCLQEISYRSFRGGMVKCRKAGV